MATPAQDDNTSDTTPQEKQVPPKREKKTKVLTLPPQHFPRTQLQVAALVVAKHGPNMRWCADDQAWFTWNGNVWQKNTDEHCSVYRWTRETIIGLIRTAADIEDDAQRKACLDLAMKWQNHAVIVAVMQNIKSDVTIDLTNFDTHPWLLTVQNGTINLKTGLLEESRRDNYITKEAPTTFDPTATATAWDEFVAWRCQNSPDFMAYQQRLAGSCLVGTDEDQQFNIDVGDGGNGKSKFWGAIFRTLGPYAVMVKADTIMDLNKNGGGAARADIMALKGARLALVAEGEDGQRLAEGLVKLLTGGDMISARSPYGRREVNFWPTHKLVMFTNHTPIIRGSDDGIWRRVHLLPSHASIVADVAAGLRKKVNLDPIFDALRPGILNWLIRGCLDWQQHGLGTCNEVETATAAYKAEMDLIGLFLGEYLPTKQALDNLTVKEVYEAYRLWCDESGRSRTAYSKQRFNDDIRKRGGVTVNGYGNNLFWTNLDAVLTKMNAAAEAARKDDPSHATSTPPADQGPTVACPSCGQTITDSCVTGDGDGKIAACPGCGRVYSVKFYFKGAF
jgi:putative DNA primase/helicase